ncbi:MAG: HAD family phosphatase [Erysipelotrichaceae bacterium]|nr:HAD family phosphatase [Erysipelotrichaceae bacterium]
MKLIMLDVDGTLINSKRELTPITIEALRFVKKLGIKVGIATGRATFVMDKWIKEHQIEDVIDYVVGFNGVEVKDYQNNTMEVSDMMSAEMTREVAIKSRNMPWNVVAYDEHCRYAKVADSHIIGYSQMTGQPYAVYDFETGEKEWAKVSFYTFENANFTEEEFALMPPLMTDTYHGFRTSPFTFEIVNANVSKVKGIRKVCNKLGITIDEVMAFGDSGNDVEMLKAVGLSVVVANGTPDALAVADAVTLSNDEDGVAHYLYNYFKKEN